MFKRNDTHSPPRTGPVLSNIILWALLFIATLAAFIPFTPHMPGDSLDASWMYGMNEAVARGLVFGRDVVFTFGPYASIYTKVFHPATDGLMVWGSLYLGLSFFLAVVAVFGGTGAAWRVGLLLTLPLTLYARDALFFFYPLLVATYVLRRGATSMPPHRETSCDLGRLILLFAPLGLYPLIKGSTLVSCLAAVALSAIWLARDRKWKSLLLVCLAPATSMVAFWLLAAQPLSALPSYFISMSPIISGYTEAMMIHGNPREVAAYIVCGLLLLAALLRESSGGRARKGAVFILFSAVLFLAFKAGFVRHDAHAVIASTMMLMAALLAGTLLSMKTTSLVVTVAAVSWLYIFSNHIDPSPKRLLTITASTYSDVVKGLGLRLDDALGRDYEHAVTALRERAGFPRLQGRSDIYSYDQSYLIASGADWHPRPILQSYSAYTPELLEKNRQHLLRDGRPEHIVFKIQTIDGRLPSLDDGASWPVLLAGYQPTRLQDGYLFLNAKGVGESASGTYTQVTATSHRVGEVIDLPQHSGLLLAKLAIEPTLLGRIVGALYKPSALEVRLTLENGSERSYRLVSGMAQSGFLISPFVEHTEEFGLLYAGADALTHQKIKSIVLTTQGSKSLWKSEFDVEFVDYRYEPDALALARLGDLGLVAPVGDDKFPDVRMAASCDGNIEYVNGVTPAPESFSSSLFLDVHGWLVKSAKDGLPAESIYIVLTGQDGRRHFVQTTKTARPDVGEYFSNPELNDSGYTTRANISQLAGNYTLALAYLEGGYMNVCPQFKVAAKFQ